MIHCNCHTASCFCPFRTWRTSSDISVLDKILTLYKYPLKVSSRLMSPHYDTLHCTYPYHLLSVIIEYCIHDSKFLSKGRNSILTSFKVSTPHYTLQWQGSPPQMDFGPGLIANADIGEGMSVPPAGTVPNCDALDAVGSVIQKTTSWTWQQKGPMLGVK